MVAANPPAQGEAAHLSIVVLPFTNISGDPSQDYFADGITEDLTTELSRIQSSFVIARNTAYTLKGKDVDAKEIGKELGVRYVLEGSVQRDQNRVRINAQLIDAESGAHLWADRFEEDFADLFKLQDQVVGRLANTVGPAFVIAEAEKGARSKNPDSIDLTMRGWALTVIFRSLASQPSGVIASDPKPSHSGRNYLTVLIEERSSLHGAPGRRTQLDMTVRTIYAQSVGPEA